MVTVSAEIYVLSIYKVHDRKDENWLRRRLHNFGRLVFWVTVVKITHIWVAYKILVSNYKLNERLLCQFFIERNGQRNVKSLFESSSNLFYRIFLVTKHMMNIFVVST